MEIVQDMELFQDIEIFKDLEIIMDMENILDVKDKNHTLIHSTTISRRNIYILSRIYSMCLQT